ncbi:hypothetical protein SSX86_017631 [Deinandra increscens subsp. villosa]|uniref:Peptidase A1 domain-containing protein n=1 Tax=Deinandra increscens subsp. villosa TaxID=3103831 RepID=A0AAP0D2V6_9ASTR
MLFIIIILLTLTHICHSAATNSFLRLPLRHVTPPQSPAQSLSADSARLSALLSTLHRKQPNLPVTSGAYAGAGQYFVTLHLGTPPQPLLLIADTGSDLIWVACSACRSDCAATRPPHSAFLARHSSSYSLHHCFDPACRLVPHPRANRVCNNRTRLHSPCRYEYSYADGSLSTGLFAKETTSFNSTTGRLIQQDSLTFGCGFKMSGPSVSGPGFHGAQGVMGLGRGPISFVTQLGRRFGNKFSYCLKDYTVIPPPTSYLLIGTAPGSSRFRYTPLIQTTPLSSPFYYIGIKSIYVDNVKLRISPSVWKIDKSGNGGTIVDSGTTLTFLPDVAYREVLAAFRRRVKLPTPETWPPNFDLCFNVSGDQKPKVPKLSFKLAGDSVFSPPAGNYFIDTAEDVKCFALQPVTSPDGFSVIGNLMQQGFLMEFDIGKSRLGYSRRGCSK